MIVSRYELAHIFNIIVLFIIAIPVSALGGPPPSSSSNEGTTPNIQRLCSAVTTGFAQLVQTTSGRHLLFTSSPQVLPGNPTGKSLYCLYFSNQC